LNQRGVKVNFHPFRIVVSQLQPFGKTNMILKGQVIGVNYGDTCSSRTDHLPVWYRA